ncbi:Fic family protein [Sulfurospirillum arcachonense]|uniref:Fic family protein n=1 Tax=Sulfurospirillum arcachonense TaxID=57666 RepID=UPI0004B28245|nr:Fic family protein [Sulfurospirillum arcachonense]
MSVENIKLVAPSFDSTLVDVLLELNHVRKLVLSGSTYPEIFFQLKEIFHMMESIGSARIEGNRTTISEYIEEKINKTQDKSEQYSEIANVEEAMKYIEESISFESKITHQFIRELHHLTVNKLSKEGDKTPGSYRKTNVGIALSEHKPPEHYLVQEHMEDLLNFINEETSNKYDLLKVAQVHHRFTWIHPFGNGNGRTVRLLTYALLIKYGFNVKEGSLLNPSAVFFNDRDKYYEMLSIADKMDDESMLVWTEYVLKGILEEIEKINKLTDYSFLSKHILFPAIAHAKDRGQINDKEYKILSIAIKHQIFASKDISDAKIGLTERQRTFTISKLKESGLIYPDKKGGRKYFINFVSSHLLRSIILMLEKEKFIPEINR